MAELTLLERRRIEAGVLVPMIRAMQAEFGEERVNEIVGRTIREIARGQGAANRAEMPEPTVQQVADRFVNGVLKEGSLIVDVVEQDEARFGFNVTRLQVRGDVRGTGSEGPRLPALMQPRLRVVRGDGAQPRFRPHANADAGSGVLRLPLQHACRFRRLTGRRWSA